MPTPHDYYRHDSDNPKLHARGNSRHYVEPDWQAHAAGIQLPEISTIGRGPRGDGVFAANFHADGKEFSFDMVSDATGDVIEAIGPIPTGQVDVSAVGNLMTITTNVLGVDGQVHKRDTVIDLPQAEDGARIFLVENSDTPRYKTSSDLYQIPRASLYCYNSQNTHREDEIPEPRMEDLVMFIVYSDETNRLPEMAYGFFASLDGPDDVLVKAIEYLPTIKGAPGDTGPKGEDGKTPKFRYCLYSAIGQLPPIHPFGGYSIELDYIGTVDYEFIREESYGAVFRVKAIADDNPPSHFDFVSVQNSAFWINANATVPWIHNLWIQGLSPFGGPDNYGTIDTPLSSFRLISMGPAPSDWSIGPEEWSNVNIEVMGAWAILACIDHSDDEPVEPTMRYYFDKAGTPGWQEHKFTLTVDGLARKIGDAEQSHLFSDDSTISPGWGRYTFNGTEYPVVETTVTGTEGDYTTVFEITAYNDAQVQSLMGVRMYYEVVPNSSTMPDAELS